MALQDYLSANASLQELSFFAFSFFTKFFKPEQFQYLTNYINTCVTFVQFHIICHGNVYWTLNSHIDTTIDIHIHTCMHPKYSNVTVIIPPLANASLNKLHRIKFPVFRLAQTSCLDLQTYPRYVRHTHSFCIYIFKATVIPHCFSSIMADVFLNAFTLCHQGSLQNNPPLLVSLVVLRGKLVHPAKFCVTVLAGDVANHVSPRQHDAVLYLTVVQVDHFIEEEGSACGT